MIPGKEAGKQDSESAEEERINVTTYSIVRIEYTPYETHIRSHDLIKLKGTETESSYRLIQVCFRRSAVNQL